MKRIITIFIFIMFCVPTFSFAADISFLSDKTKFAQGEEFLVQVFVDTKNVSVNALEGTIKFPTDELALKEVRDGNSVLNFWIEKPESMSPGEVSFSGITSGGFSGAHMLILSMVFEAKKPGTSSIVFNKVQILQNNGLASKVSVNAIPFRLEILKETSLATKLSISTDTDPPEIFTPFVTNNPDIFGGKNFLVFSTVDKGTGIDYYEVSESKWGIDGSYQKAVSPYLLTDQNLESAIYVKALDRAGNERRVMLPPQNKTASYELYAALSLMFVLAIIAAKKLWPKISKK